MIVAGLVSGRHRRLADVWTPDHTARVEQLIKQIAGSTYAPG